MKWKVLQVNGLTPLKLVGDTGGQRNSISVTTWGRNGEFVGSKKPAPDCAAEYFDEQFG